MVKKTRARRRNAQDATRRYDVAPLRRRIENVERAIAELFSAVAHILDELVGMKKGKSK